MYKFGAKPEVMSARRTKAGTFTIVLRGNQKIKSMDTKTLDKRFPGWRKRVR